MPENAEAYIISEQLKSKLLNKTIIHYELSGLLKTSGFDNFILPAKIINIRSHGKKVIFEFPLQLMIISLGMSGKFKYESLKHNHVDFTFENMHLYYNDVRRIGSKIDIINNNDLTYFSKLGPCLLSAALSTWISKEQWMTFYYHSGKRAIVDILLDQSIVAGIGNYLRIDILYMAGIDPLRIGNDLTKDEIERIRIASHEIVLLSYQLGGHTLRDYITPNNEKGGYQPFIYGRKKDQHGFKVNQYKLHGRTVHYVNEVQN